MFSVIAYVIRSLIEIDSDDENMSKRQHDEIDDHGIEPMQRSCSLKKTESLSQLSALVEVEKPLKIKKSEVPIQHEYPKVTYYGSSSSFYYKQMTQDSCTAMCTLNIKCHMCHGHIANSETIYCYRDCYFHNKCFIGIVS